jgi:antitoxin MazE
MQVQISKWGNSLGLRVPRSLARQAGIADGGKVNITADGNRLIIESVTHVVRLEDLLANMTPEKMGAAFDWGGDIGREAVND